MLSSRIGVIGVTLTALLLLVGVAAPLIAPAGPFEIDGPSLAAPSWDHPMGTDALGRDVLSGVVYGARTSLIVAMGVGALVLIIGLAVGTVSGYSGGKIDDMLMRATEVFQVIPRFFLAVLAIAFFGPGLDRIVLVIGLTSWTTLARTVRSEVLSLRETEFVQAAHALGASRLRVIRDDLIPSALPSALVIVGLVLAHALLLEASLGFLGLGDPNAMSWGTLASEAQQFLRVAWWLSLFPGIAITLAVLGLNLLGDALNQALAGRS
jgi:peptide/nickel transport system permease protein